MVPHGSGEGSESRFRSFVNSRCYSPATLVGLRSYNTAILQEIVNERLGMVAPCDASILADSRETVKRTPAPASLATRTACHPFPPVARSHAPY